MKTGKPARHWKKNGLSIYMTRLSFEAIHILKGSGELPYTRRSWRLTEDFSLVITGKNMSQKVTVPKRFDTDFATIPKILQLVLGNRDDWAEAAVLHDWLCVTHVPRFISNAWMRAALFVLGCPRWKRILFFYGLMFFGYGSGISRAYEWFIKLVKR